jgi:hypothetical protein
MDMIELIGFRLTTICRLKGRSVSYGYDRTDRLQLNYHLSHYFNCAINVPRVSECHVGEHEKLLN